ncbi:MAG: HAD family hydrolase [Chitinispirillia bacterium]
MSFVAEFARELHEKEKKNITYECTPLTTIVPKISKLHDIKLAVFDIYGTMVQYWRQEFSESGNTEKALLAAFRKTSDFFNMTEYLEKINPVESPETTLKNFYHGLIALNHEKKLRNGFTFPEIRIEVVWEAIILILERHGYSISNTDIQSKYDCAKCMAYYYHFHSLGRGFYENVFNALIDLKRSNILCGILSNAQFYTEIDLTLFLRDQSKNKIDDYLELFDSDFIYLSYEYGVAKPNPILFKRLFDAMKEYQILPHQSVFIGNDLSLDIKPAQEIGMMTAFFCGDTNSAFIHDMYEKVVPDITFSSWEELPSKILFFEKSTRK